MISPVPEVEPPTYAKAETFGFGPITEGLATGELWGWSS
jgi:hypothetical protein